MYFSRGHLRQTDRIELRVCPLCTTMRKSSNRNSYPHSNLLANMLKLLLLCSFLAVGVSRPYPYRPFGVRRAAVGDLTHLVDFERPIHVWHGFRYEEQIDDHAKSQLGMRSQGRQPLAVQAIAPNEPKIWRLCRRFAECYPSISNSVYRGCFAASLCSIIQGMLCFSYLWLSWLSLKKIETQPATLWILIDAVALSFAFLILSVIVDHQYLTLWYAGIENKQKQEIRDSDERRWSGEIIAPRQMETKYPTRFPYLAKALDKLSSKRGALYFVIRDYIPTLLVVLGILTVLVLPLLLIDSIGTKVLPVIEILLKRIGLRRLRADDLFDILIVAVRKDFIWICCGSLLALFLFVNAWGHYVEYFRASGRELCRGQ